MANPSVFSAVGVFRRHDKELLGVLKAISDLVSLAMKLYKRGIISRKTLKEIMRQPGCEKNETIMEAIRKAMETGRALEFLSVLEQQSLADEMVAKMRSELSK